MFRKFFSKKIKKTLAKAERFWYNEFKASSTTASSTTAFFLYMSIVLFACQILYYGGTFEMKKGNFKAVLMAALVMGFVLACNDKVFASGGGFTYVNVACFKLFKTGSGNSSWLDCKDQDFIRVQCVCYDGSCEYRLHSEDDNTNTVWESVKCSTSEKSGHNLYGDTRVRVELRKVKKASATGYIWVY